MTVDRSAFSSPRKDARCIRQQIRSDAFLIRSSSQGNIGEVVYQMMQSLTYSVLCRFL